MWQNQNLENILPTQKTSPVFKGSEVMLGGDVIVLSVRCLVVLPSSWGVASVNGHHEEGGGAVRGENHQVA